MKVKDRGDDVHVSIIHIIIGFHVKQYRFPRKELHVCDRVAVVLKSRTRHIFSVPPVCVIACRVVVSAQSSPRLSLTTWDNCWYWDDGCIPQGNIAINALLVCLHMCVALLVHDWFLQWCSV